MTSMHSSRRWFSACMGRARRGDTIGNAFNGSVTPWTGILSRLLLMVSLPRARSDDRSSDARRVQFEIRTACDQGVRALSANGLTLYERILALPSPGTKVERSNCSRSWSVEDASMPGCWLAAGRAGVGSSRRSRGNSVSVHRSPDHTKNKKASREFTNTIRALGRSLKSKKRRKAWAESLLDVLQGNGCWCFVEILGRSGLRALCGFADRPVPSVAEIEADLPSG